MNDIVAFFAGTEEARASNRQYFTEAMRAVDHGSIEQHALAAIRRRIANTPWPTPKEA